MYDPTIGKMGLSGAEDICQSHEQRLCHHLQWETAWPYKDFTACTVSNFSICFDFNVI